MSSKYYLTEHTIFNSIQECPRFGKQFGCGSAIVAGMNGFREILKLSQSDAPALIASRPIGTERDN
jgi:hypothetical protein